ncbi:MAG TPA: hypothetical protein DCS07_09260 [Bdellovibrionales bacterium]|nr:hypothetical protein [Bdellovibrionales bacterium]HCM41651.1 hypothetical protein [Bdellovibrionales bacterium]
MFEWDENKASLNLKKHGISFEKTQSCFSDPGIVMGHDLSHSGNEDRYIGIAKSEAGRILTFIFTIRRARNGKETFRIISSRQASSKERKAYPR